SIGAYLEGLISSTIPSIPIFALLIELNWRKVLLSATTPRVNPTTLRSVSKETFHDEIDVELIDSVETNPNPPQLLFPSTASPRIVVA
ncbi:hypothetical protein PENTCL1PPCAC_1413, partial [Pristionchus entomophagus]